MTHVNIRPNTSCQGTARHPMKIWQCKATYVFSEYVYPEKITKDNLDSKIFVPQLGIHAAFTQWLLL